MANNRICLACGKAYEYCGSCENTRKLPVWKNLFDTESCKDIFECTSDYLQKAITKERAQKRLSTCDLSKVSDMKDEIRKIAEEIIHEDKQNPQNNKYRLVPDTLKYNNKKMQCLEIHDIDALRKSCEKYK